MKIFGIAVTFPLCFAVCASGGGGRDEALVPDYIEPVDGPSFRQPFFTLADPFVMRYEGWYYLMGTTGGNIRLNRARRLADFSGSPQSKVIWTPTPGRDNSAHIWAPEIHRLDGKWYVYYTATNKDTPIISRRNWVLECTGDDPFQGPWVEKGKIAAEPDCWAIDGSILEANGNRYYIWSGWEEGARQEAQNIYIALMENPWTISGRRVLISKPEYPWEKRPSPRGFALVNEGPQAMYTENHVAVVYSASHYNSDGYCLGMLRIKKGDDPLVASNWKKNDQPLFSGSARRGIWSPGHHSFFTSPDGAERWFAYHAYTTPWSPGSGYGDAKRQSFALPYSLDENEAPVFGEPVPAGARTKAPSGEE